MNDDVSSRRPSRPPDPYGPGDEFDDDDLLWEEYEEPAVPLRLSASQEAALAAAIEAGVQARGCDNTLRAAREWAAAAGLDWDELRAGLEGRGGFCDCEVLLNVGLRST